MTAFLKLTPVQGTTVTGQKIKNERYTELLWDTISYVAVLRLITMEVFAKSEWYTKTSLIDYFVVKILFFTEDGLLSQKGEDQEDILSNLISNTHQKVFKFVVGEDTFYCEMAMYDYVSEESNQNKINDPSIASSSLDTLILFQNIAVPGQVFCRDNTITAVRKTHVCPFITLNVNELSIGRTLGIPHLANVGLNNTYSTFDYMIAGENISLCVSDFIILYDILKVASNDNGNKSSCQFCKLTYILHIFCISYILY